MYIPAVRSYLSGFYSSIRTKLSPWVPSISWSRVKESFSSVGEAFKSTPLPLTEKQISASQMDLLREELFPEDEELETVVAQGGVLRQIAHNQFEFTERNCAPRYFEDADAFSKYLESRVEEVSFWTIEVEGSDRVFYKYWDEFEGSFENFPTKNALYHAIGKEGDGAFKVIDKASGTITYVRDRLGYFSMSFEEFSSEQLFLEAIQKDKQKRAFVLKCFAGFTAVATVGGAAYYLNSQRVDNNTTNTQLDLYHPNGQFGSLTHARLLSNFQLMSASTNSSALPPLTLTEEVPYVGNEWVVSDLFGPEYNGAIVSANSLPNGLMINSGPVRELSSFQIPPTLIYYTALTQSENIVFLSYFNTGILQVIDSTDGPNAFVVNTINSIANGMAVEGELLYSAGNYFQVRDFSNLYQIKLLGSKPFSGYLSNQPQPMLVANKICYVSGNTFDVMDASMPSNLNHTASLPISSVSMAFIDDTHILLATPSSSVVAVDVSNKLNVRVVGTLTLPDTVSSLVVKGTVCSAVGNANFYRIDVSDVTNMKLLSSRALFNSAWKISTVNDLYYVIDSTAIKVVNAQNNTFSTVVNSFFSGGLLFDHANIQVSNDYCFIVDSIALRVTTRGNTFGLRGTPKGGTRGNHTAQLTLQNPQGKVVNGPVDISVLPAITLQQPIGSQLAVVGSDVNLFINSDTFKQINGNTMRYSAAQLPSWLSLNPVSGAFAGKPTDAGSFEIVVTATDNDGATASTTLSLNVVFGPNANMVVQTQVAKVNAPFSHTLPQNAIISKDNSPLIFTATDNGLPLPGWLTFDATTLTLSGIPPSASTVQVVITGQDANGLTAQLNFQIISVVSAAPVLLNPISNQFADVGVEFRFFIPSGSFADPYGRPISFSASLAGGDSLPSWLSFVNETFFGTPLITDTDSFSARVLPILLVAKTDTGTLSHNFEISVGGQSIPSLLLRIFGPIFGITGFIFGLYRKRAWVLNCWNRRKYQKLKANAVVGKAYVHKLTVDQEKVDAIQVLSKGRLLGREGALPKGFDYNRFTNRIESTKVPKPRRLKELTFRVVDAANVILEEFTLTIVNEAAEVDLEEGSKVSASAVQGDANKELEVGAEDDVNGETGEVELEGLT